MIEVNARRRRRRRRRRPSAVSGVEVHTNRASPGGYPAAPTAAAAAAGTGGAIMK